MDATTNGTWHGPPEALERLDRRGFDAVALSVLPSLYRVANSLTANPAVAEDMIVKTLRKARESWAGRDEGVGLKVGLLRILADERLSDPPERRDPRPVAGGQIDDRPPPTRLASDSRPGRLAALETVTCEMVSSALESLPGVFRLILLLADAESLSYREIAYVLRIPVDAVESRLSSARHRFEEQLWEAVGAERTAPEDHEALSSAVAESRAQADLLRRALNEAESLIDQCRNLLDGLRAILVYPRAYEWPVPIRTEPVGNAAAPGRGRGDTTDASLIRIGRAPPTVRGRPSGAHTDHATQAMRGSAVGLGLRERAGQD